MPTASAARKPAWLRRPLGQGAGARALARQLEARGLSTICREGGCPNQGECLGRGVASFLVMGRVCTRACGFCAVSRGRPQPLDPDEPRRLAGQVAEIRRARIEPGR